MGALGSCRSAWTSQRGTTNACASDLTPPPRALTSVASRVAFMNCGLAAVVVAGSAYAPSPPACRSSARRSDRVAGGSAACPAHLSYATREGAPAATRHAHDTTRRAPLGRSGTAPPPPSPRGSSYLTCPCSWSLRSLSSSSRSSGQPPPHSLFVLVRCLALEGAQNRSERPLGPVLRLGGRVIPRPPRSRCTQAGRATRPQDRAADKSVLRRAPSGLPSSGALVSSVLAAT